MNYFSSAETILAINEDSNPKALINIPLTSNELNFIKITAKYTNITKLII